MARKEGETYTTTIQAERKGRAVTLDVRVHTHPTADTCWVRKADGGPLYGSTGYSKRGGNRIETYRGRTILENVRGL